MTTIRTTHAADKKTGMTAKELRSALHDATGTPTVTTSWSGKVRTITVESDDPDE